MRCSLLSIMYFIYQKIYECAYLVRMHRLCYIFVEGLYNSTSAGRTHMGIFTTPHQDEHINLFSHACGRIGDVQQGIEQFTRVQQEHIEQARLVEQDELEALVTRVLQGDHSAFRIIFDQYNSLMLHT